MTEPLMTVRADIGSGAPYPLFGVLPQTTTDPAEARALVMRDGAAVLRTSMHSATEACGIGHTVFGSSVLAIPEAAEVREAGGLDRKYAGVSQHTRSKAHTDGFSYGNEYPDYFLLLCDESSPVGGESFLLDGPALLAWTAEQPGGAAFVERLTTVDVEQTEPGKRKAVGPMVGRSASGRPMFRRFPEQQPAEDSADPSLDHSMIAAWHQLVDDVSVFSPRFKLEPGDAVIIDNYRLFHGREPYSDLSRRLWRVWIWTTEGSGVPTGLLHSDSRFAGSTA